MRSERLQNRDYDALRNPFKRGGREERGAINKDRIVVEVTLS
jgi:hypothetical protein